MLKRTIILVVVFVLSIPSISLAQKYAGEFMALGGGARAMGMGGAYTAVAGDATTCFWNPAGLILRGYPLSSGNDWEAVFMHSERFGNLIDYNFVSLSFPMSLGKSAWGITLIHMGIDDIRVVPFRSGMIGGKNDGDMIFEPWLGEKLNFDYKDYPLESVNDYALFFSYAQMLSFGALGATVKVIRDDQVADVSSLGIGIDIAFLKRDVWKRMILGMKFQDITGTFIAWSTGKKEFIYPAIKFGVAYPLEISRLSSVFLLAVDGDFRFENRRYVSQFWLGRASADFHVGAELVIREIVAIRGGLDVDRPTAGIGFILKDFSPWKFNLGIDYALLLHDVLDTTHRVSILLSH